MTGGAHGIGAAIAARLARDGWRVVVADMDRERSRAARRTLCPCATWRTKQRSAALIAGVAAQEGRLDALVCNAGINIRKPIAQLTLAEWSRVIGTNLTSTFLLTRAAEAMLRAAQRLRGDDCIHARPHVGSRHRGLCRVEGWAGRADARAVDQPRTGRAGELHQSRLDLHQGRRRRGRKTTHSIPPAVSARRRTSRHWSHSWSGPESGFITGAEFIVDGGVTRKMIYPE